jgi:dGTP triphosphohydrolase
MLSAIGLAHDLGNPPFGHQGEAAIARWFEQRKEWIFNNHDEKGRGLPVAIPDELHKEFLQFDGNPQTLRLILLGDAWKPTFGSIPLNLAVPVQSRSMGSVVSCARI